MSVIFVDHKFIVRVSVCFVVDLWRLYTALVVRSTLGVFGLSFCVSVRACARACVGRDPDPLLLKLSS